MALERHIWYTEASRKSEKEYETRQGNRLQSPRDF
jgi:hypothetical protein